MVKIILNYLWILTKVYSFIADTLHIMSILKLILVFIHLQISLRSALYQELVAPSLEFVLRRVNSA